MGGHKKNHDEVGHTRFLESTESMVFGAHEHEIWWDPNSRDGWVALDHEAIS